MRFTRIAKQYFPSVALAFGLALIGACATSPAANITAGAGAASPSAGSNTTSGSSPVSGAGGAGGATAACTMCVTTADCGKGAACGQFGGDSFCAPDCSAGQVCASGRSCTGVSSIEGMPVQLCIPTTNICGGGAVAGVGASSSAASTGAGPATSGAATGAGPAGSTGAGGPPTTCGVLDGPSVPACCMSCKPGQVCQANGCYGGWWCSSKTCKCQPAPAGNCGSSSASSSTSASSSSSSSSSSGGGGAGPIGPGGGSLDALSFAIVGDTRPPGINDTAGYPSSVAQQIWNDVEAFSPRPPFAVTTGDYMFASVNSGQAGPQLDLYLAARAGYTNMVFPALGNHECTGGVTSNCGPGTVNGNTDNYQQFVNKLLGPLGTTTPYYVVNVNAKDNSWTAKFVIVAANAWTSTQSSWFSGVMAQPTTYTFVVRHERTSVTAAPGVSPSNAIIKQFPLTMLIVGHTHTYQHVGSANEIVVGNGGAPLTGGVNYGYVIATRRADGAITFKEYDYATNAEQDSFAVKADGSATP